MAQRRVTAWHVKRCILARYDRFVAEHDGEFPTEVFTLATKQDVARDLGIRPHQVDKLLSNEEPMSCGYYDFKQHLLARNRRGHFISWEYGRLYLPWPRN